jgi:cellulose synthase/poly-beta-1,6-N-acetylglucosamine synthase-like glycosyltransferase
MIALIRWALILIGGAGVLLTVPSWLELLLMTIGAFRRRLPSSARVDSGFRLAAVVPAHNEEAMVGSCVKSILISAQTGPSCEVIVVADNCTDGTAARARAAGARVLIREDSQRRGKGYALRFAFERLMEE